MLAVSFDQVSKRYGAQALLEDVSFQINVGEKVGLIGPNGCGKTTLLNVLIGREPANGGTVVVPKAVRLGYVTQYAEHDVGQGALACVLSEHAKTAAALAEAERHLSQATPASLDGALAAYEAVRQAFEWLGGDTFAQRARAMLDALGLGGKLDQPVAALSGGEQNIVTMSRALLANPDLLVLDEPGNHLDFLGIAWLEDFLKRFPGAVLMVSHNRYLLDRVVGRVFHLEDGRLDAYEGNFSDCRAQRLRALVNQQAAYAADQKRLARLEAQVKRLQQTAHALGDAASGRRYRAMRTRFEREQKHATDKPQMSEAGVEARFSVQAAKADIALELRGYSKRFGKNVLFEGAQLRVAAGERLALVGPNGCGKTTLLRDIVAQGAWEHDVIRIGPSQKVGYASQLQEQLQPGRTLLEETLAAGGLTRERAIALLDRFRFPYEHLHKRVEDLSGGERNRLQLAKLMVQQPNFLILDEPTNHLDIPTCEAVEEALEDYAGTLLVVSHDRYFLDNTIQRVVEVRDRKLHTFPGNFSAFWEARQQQDQTPVVGRVTKRRRQRENAYKKTQHDQQRQQLEAQIEAAEAEKVALESRIAEAFSKGQHQQGRRLANELALLKAKLDDLLARWVDGE